MGHQFELLIEKRMVGTCYPETSKLNTAMRCSSTLMRKRLQSGSSGPFAENAWTARYFGTGPTRRRSCAISNISITSIACALDAKDTRRRRASTPMAHEQRISVVIDGRSMVEAHTKRRLPRDLVIRHRHHSARHRYRQATTAVQPSPSRSGNQPARVGEVQRHRCWTSNE